MYDRLKDKKVDDDIIKHQEEPELTFGEHCKAKVGYDVAIVIDSLGSIVASGKAGTEVNELLIANMIILEKIVKDKK